MIVELREAKSVKWGGVIWRQLIRPILHFLQKERQGIEDLDDVVTQ